MSELGAVMPPGWYYAEGDPPGTHRYWDGSQWTGGPQPIQVNQPGAYASPQLVQPANVGPRIAAFLIDVVFAFALLIGLALAQVSDDYLVIGYLVFLLLWFGNQVILQGITGQTLGKKAMGLILVNEATGELVGVAKAFGRFVIPMLFNFVCGIYGLVDYAWPLFDARNQRLTDKMFSLAVTPVAKEESYL